MTFYEIDAAIMNCIDPETGEVDGDQIEALTVERNKKIDNVVHYIINLNSDINELKAEIDRLQNIKRSDEATIDRLKELLRNVLAGEKHKGTDYAVSYRKSKAVVVDDELMLEEVFKRVSYTPDKTKIKEALAAGAAVRGAHLEEREAVIIK